MKKDNNATKILIAYKRLGRRDRLLVIAACVCVFIIAVFFIKDNFGLAKNVAGDVKSDIGGMRIESYDKAREEVKDWLDEQIEKIKKEYSEDGYNIGR